MIKEIKLNKMKGYEIKVGDTNYYVIVESIGEFRNFHITKSNCSIISFQIGYSCDNVLEEINKHIVEWICDYEDELRRMENSYE